MKLILIAMVAATLAAAQPGGEAERLFSAAKNLETVDGNLQAAIKQYNAIVSKYGKSDRPVAAMALVRMAQCYQKLGNAQAQKIYERILKDYADQKDAVALARSSLGQNTSATEPVTKKIWSSPTALEYWPAVSTNGRYVTWLNEKTNSLMLHDLETGADRELVADPKKEQADAAESFSASLSRDGRQVAYTWFNTGDKMFEVRVQGLDGSSQRRIYSARVEFIGLHDWSPDGKWIAATIQQKDKTVQLALLSIADGSLRLLKTAGKVPQGDGDEGVYFSPDGRYLGYDAEVDGRSIVFVQSVDGASEITAADYHGENKMMGWSPDGRLLIANDRTDQMSLWALPYADGKVQGSEEFMAILGRVLPLGVSASGTVFYEPFLSGWEGGRTAVASLDPVSGRQLSAFQEIDHGQPWNTESPAFSPDGKWMAYLAGRRTIMGGVWPEIRIRSVATGDTVRVLAVKDGVQVFSWSPDGTAFIAERTDPEEHPAAFRIDALTGAVTPIASPPQEFDTFKVSPDGKTIYYRRTIAESKEIVFVARDVASGAERVLTRRARLGQIVLSPDGRYIATGSLDSSGKLSVLLLIPTAGGAPREVMSVPNPDRLVAPVWAADSRGFFFLKQSAENQPNEIWREPLDGVPTRLEATLERGVSWVAGYGISPDGKQLAYCITRKPPAQDAAILGIETALPAGTGGGR